MSLQSFFPVAWWLLSSIFGVSKLAECCVMYWFHRTLVKSAGRVASQSGIFFWPSSSWLIRQHFSPHKQQWRCWRQRWSIRTHHLDKITNIQISWRKSLSQNSVEKELHKTHCTDHLGIFFSIVLFINFKPSDRSFAFDVGVSEESTLALKQIVDCKSLIEADSQPYRNNG